jgi:hypothetical protein
MNRAKGHPACWRAAQNSGGNEAEMPQSRSKGTAQLQANDEEFARRHLRDLWGGVDPAEFSAMMARTSNTLAGYQTARTIQSPPFLSFPLFLARVSSSERSEWWFLRMLKAASEENAPTNFSSMLRWWLTRLGIEVPSGVFAPLEATSAGPPLRTPNLEISRERIALVDQAATELATIKRDLAKFCTPVELKEKYPNFTIWNMLFASELKELVDGAQFRPKAYAENLVLRKYGLQSRETIKKDRKKIRAADR